MTRPPKRRPIAARRTTASIDPYPHTVSLPPELTDPPPPPPPGWRLSPEPPPQIVRVPVATDSGVMAKIDDIHRVMQEWQREFGQLRLHVVPDGLNRIFRQLDELARRVDAVQGAVINLGKLLGEGKWKRKKDRKR